MEFNVLLQRALQIRAKYAQLEEKRYGKAWTNAQLAQGCVGDIGDLMKLIMAKEGVRAIPDVDNKLAHELADCLWSIIVIASKYDVDLEGAFFKTMNDLESMVDAKLGSAP